MTFSFEQGANLSPYGSVGQARAALDAAVEREWRAKTLPDESSARAALAEADALEQRAIGAIPALETAVARALGAVEDLEGQISARREQLRMSQNRRAETLASAVDERDALSVASANADTQIAEACLKATEAKLSAPLAEARATVVAARAALDAANDAAASAKRATLRAAIEHRFVQLAAPLIEEAAGLIASFSEAASPQDVKRLLERVTEISSRVVDQG